LKISFMAASAGIGSLVEDRTEEKKPIDREKTCPLLLRVFCANGRHNPMNDYNRGNVPTNELQIYTWMDCTLRELTQLIKEVNPDARRRGTIYEFSVVYPDPRSNTYRLRDIGSTQSGIRGVDDNKTLHQCKFEIGDYIDVAISLPGANRAPPRRSRPY